MCFFVQTNHTRKELLFLMFKEINLRNHSSLHKLFYSLGFTTTVLADEDTTVETVATYNYNKMPADTLATIKDIVANDNTISMKVKDGYLILTKFIPILQS